MPGLAPYTAWSFAHGTTFSVEGIDASRRGPPATTRQRLHTQHLSADRERPDDTSFAEGFKTVRSAVRCGDVHPRYVQKLTAAQTEAPWIAATDSLTSRPKLRISARS